MATITEVAQRAGVSVKTVSRVMNNYQHISARTREKVEDAMRDLDYAPSSIARQLKLGGSLSIGMLYGDPSSGYQSRLNHAVLKACSDARRYLAVELFDEKSTEWLTQVEAFLDRTKVQNLILVPPMCDSADLHGLLKERRVNFVLISPSSPAPGVSSIAINDRRAARQIVSHIIELGHTKIGHICGRPDHVATLLRRQGYEEALQQADLSVREDYVLPGRFRFKIAVECAEKLLTLEEPPTAIFADNDEMAAAVVMTANRLGLRVPEDLSVAGFDDTPIAQTIWPELTTIAQPFEAMAEAAVESMRTPQSNDQAISRTLILEHRLIVRGSTGPAPAP